MKIDVLKFINNLLYRECSSCIPLGLKGGKLGIAIFWALYSEKVMNASCRKRATRVLNDIIGNIELLSDNFLSGKMGFGWGMFLLINKGILNLDSEMQSLLNYISRLSSYSLDGHPFQLSLDDSLFSKGVYKLKQRTCYENISRYIIDEELIVFVDECENLLSCKIEKIYTPEQLTLQELNSVLYFLKEIKSRKIFPFKANLLIGKIEELYNKQKKKSFVEESVYQILASKEYNLSFNGKEMFEKLKILGELGFYSLIYEESRIFNVPFYKLIYDEPDIERNILKILKEEPVSLNILCGLGFGLLNLKELYNEKEQ